MSNPFSRGKVLSIVILVIIVLFIGWGISAYNSMVRANAGVETQWSQVENQYQRRFDLVPNLVASVQATLSQEQEVFTAIADARTRYAGAQTIDDKVNAAQSFDSALARLLVVIENYPQLKSIDAVQSFNAQLEGTENRVATERNRYNEAVQSYNVTVQTFPRSMFARLFGFAPHAYFKAVDDAQTAPKVEFNTTR